MRTYVRCERRPASSTPTSTPSTRRSSSGTTPACAGGPVIVGAGVVLSASYEARAFGVRTAMGGRMARRLCPEAVVVSPRIRAYSEASKAAYRVFDEFSPAVEGLSIDEAFLDVRGMEHFAGSPRQIAARLRAAIRAEVGLPITVGVARTKFLAKVASGVAKPDGLLVVAPAARAGVPARAAGGAGVGRRPGHRREAAPPRHPHASAQLAAQCHRRSWSTMLGRAAGRHLHALAHNRDPRPVETRRRRRSMGAQRALGRGPAQPGRGRRHAGRAGRPRHPAHAHRRPGRPHGGAAAALRRLLAGDPLAHARRARPRSRRWCCHARGCCSGWQRR